MHTLVDHIEHIIKVAGIDHVGIGSDYDGVTKLPAQLEDVSCYPYITQELLNRGYTPDDIRKILGGNLLRAMRRPNACQAGKKIRSENEAAGCSVRFDRRKSARGRKSVLNSAC